MALTVPDDSYIEVATADEYHSDRNNSAWTSASTAEKESALRQATVYLDNAYTWRGEHPRGASQLRNWPRLNVIDSQGRTRSGIPQEIKDATAELALLALSSDLRPANDRGGAIQRVKAGDVEVQYEEGAPANRSFPFVNLLVSTLTKGSGSSQAKLSRA